MKFKKKGPGPVIKGLRHPAKEVKFGFVGNKVETQAGLYYQKVTLAGVERGHR